MSLDYGLDKLLVETPYAEPSRSDLPLYPDDFSDHDDAKNLSNLHFISQQLRQISINHRLHAERIRDLSRSIK